MHPAVARSWLGGRSGLLLAVLIGAAASLFLSQTADIGELISDSEALERAQASDGSPRLTGRSSTVTAVLFTDYRCPACRSSDKALIQAVMEDGHVDLIVRPLTIFGPESERAARVGLAADRQGRFLAMHRELMSAAKINDAGIARAAQRADVNLVQLRAKLIRNRTSINEAIARNRVAAFGLGISGTPTYLIGRYRIIGALSSSQLHQLFRQARADEPAESGASKIAGAQVPMLWSPSPNTQPQQRAI